MAAGDVYLLRQIMTPSSALAPLMECVYCYRQSVGSGGAADLANVWQNTVLPVLIVLQSNTIITTFIQADNQDDLSDFALNTVATGGQGTQTGDGLPYYNAWKFQYVRVARSNHHGWKRLPGVPEGANDTGSVNAGFVTAFNNAATAMATSLADLGGNVWSPRIFRQSKPLAVPPVVRGDFAIAGVVPRGLTTQNSRKH